MTLNRCHIAFFSLLLLMLPLVNGLGQGISFDAGLTPAQNRLIVRTQYRAFSTAEGTNTTRTKMVPVVVAYGVRPGFTLMMRNMYMRQTMGSNDAMNNLMDPLLLAKFRLYRKNTANWVLGVAPHLATNVPLGFSDMNPRSWNPEVGMNISFRPRFLSFDLSTVYQADDLFAQNEFSGGGEFRVNSAFSSVVPLSPGGEIAIAPVLEMNYLRRNNEGMDRSLFQQLLFVSPGASLMSSLLTLEMLLQVPVYQQDPVSYTDQGARIIAGLKIMF
ncbi:MAG: hypothetical protein P1P82_09155 [Bacteroidales bacterium]|nr:hypothetical protein [Bacteroidales bacterium]MDT8430595.1 hypothetical protein [Bacteroidales bacterium]